MYFDDIHTLLCPPVPPVPGAQIYVPSNFIFFFLKKIIPIKVIAGGTKGLGLGQTLCDSSDSFSFYFFLIFIYLGFIFAVVWLFSFFP